MAKTKSSAAAAKAEAGTVGGASADTNTSAAEKPAIPADVSAGAVQAAPVSTALQETGAATANEGATPPAGGEAIAGVVETMTGEPGPGEQIADAGLPPVATALYPVVTHIRVAAKKDGFRRAGRAWSKAPVTVSIDEFSMQQLEDLIREPMLVVVPVAGEQD